jgi:hypothetical protein
MIIKNDLIKLLKEKVVTVKFKKKDDSVRKMVCSLSNDYLPEAEIKQPLEEKNKTKKQNPDILPVWDLEKQAWRSFRFDSVVEYFPNF